jgi:16S rRNA (uracil1498-N3)-methyltransferase
MPQREHRFYAADLSAEAVTLAPGEAHHALHVLRLGAGAEVTLFDGRGGVACGRIAEAKRGKVVVAVESRRDLGPRPEPIVHLAFAVPKGKRLDWLLEKAAELGAASLRAIAFERSVAGAGQFTPARRERWLGHCIAAAKQSGLSWLPEIHGPQPLGEFLEQSLIGAEGYFGIVGVPDGGGLSLRRVVAAEPPGRAVCILVGPEGGLTHAELSAATDAGFVPTRLGRTVLRVETAAIALLAATVAMCDRRGRGEHGE